jgi:hypothetical protein
VGHVWKSGQDDRKGCNQKVQKRAALKGRGKKADDQVAWRSDGVYKSDSSAGSLKKSGAVHYKLLGSGGREAGWPCLDLLVRNGN